MITGPTMFDRPAASAVDGSQDWLLAALLGNGMVVLCSIAIAALGIVMLSGRLPVRRGALVVLGCFVMLGAPAIASSLATLGDTAPPTWQAGETGREAVLYERPVPPAAANDTYGRASLRRQ